MTLVLKSLHCCQHLPLSTCNWISFRMFSKRLVRHPVRVFAPGEKIPMPGDRKIQPLVWNETNQKSTIKVMYQRRLKPEELAQKSIPMPVTVICDNIRDPGNLGSLIRSAAGIGCRQVLLSKGCADAWESKVLRGGAGGQFYLSLIDSIPLPQMRNYIFPEDRDERQSSELIKNTVIFIADNSENVQKDFPELPIKIYTDVDYTAWTNIFLVLGGETEGLSREIFMLANSLMQNHKISACRIRVPLQNNIESLNVANAFGIIAFEMFRQLRPKMTS